MTREEKRAIGVFKRAIERYKLLDNQDRVIVAFSGGNDSMCLVELFLFYRRWRMRELDIKAVHVDPGFPNWHTRRIEKYLKDRGLDYKIIKLNLSLDKEKDKCFVCSRRRKEAIFRYAEECDIKKIAVAHHVEDVVETYFLNLFFAGETATMLPKQEFFGGKFFIIRPLYFFTEERIKEFIEYKNLKPVPNRCPYLNFSKRMKIRKLLDKIWDNDIMIKQNVFRGIRNININFLPKF